IFGLAACGPADIYEVRSAAFSKPDAPLADRAVQVKRAGAGLGWTMKDVAPDRVDGTLATGPQSATVEVRFDPTTFSILYVDRAGLNQQGRKIDRDYNHWVERLEDAIVAMSSVPVSRRR